MSGAIDQELLAERSAAVARHLERVAEHLPPDPADRELGSRLARAAGFVM